MKLTILTLSLVLSANVFAFSSSISTLELSLIGTDEAQKVQANLVIKDSQQVLHTGVVSLFLAQKIQEIQKQNEDVSEAEALDLLIESAQNVLAK